MAIKMEREIYTDITCLPRGVYASSSRGYESELQ